MPGCLAGLACCRVLYCTEYMHNMPSCAFLYMQLEHWHKYSSRYILDILHSTLHSAGLVASQVGMMTKRILDLGRVQWLQQAGCGFEGVPK